MGGGEKRQRGKCASRGALTLPYRLAAQVCGDPYATQRIREASERFGESFEFFAFVLSTDGHGISSNCDVIGERSTQLFLPSLVLSKRYHAYDRSPCT